MNYERKELRKHARVQSSEIEAILVCCGYVRLLRMRTLRYHNHTTVVRVACYQNIFMEIKANPSNRIVFQKKILTLNFIKI